MKPLALSLAAIALTVGLQAQTAPPAATATTPWQPRPVLIINPRDVLSTPAPPRSTPRAASHRPHRPKRLPPRALPSASPAAETFTRYDTAPTAPPPPPR